MWTVVLLARSRRLRERSSIPGPDTLSFLTLLMPGRQRFGVSSYGEKRLVGPELTGRTPVAAERSGREIPLEVPPIPRARGGRDRPVSACYEINGSIACIECCTRGQAIDFRCLRGTFDSGTSGDA